MGFMSIILIKPILDRRVERCGCVGATAKGAVQTGIKVYMLSNCIGSRFPEKKISKMRDQLSAIGVEYKSDFKYV